jgi:UDP-N-acetylmuramoylalanine--D-glutamate ligase
MQLAGKSVVVVGLGRSGVAAARLCRARGARVLATDCRPAEQLSEEARSLDAELYAGGHGDVPFEQVDLVVVSPGVPPLPELDRATRAGAEVIGELELAARLCPGQLCCVGGTNGKSTTTMLASHMFEQAGLEVFRGGNLGTPLSEAVGRSWDVLLVEVSSFQLERAPTFRPHVSVLLNVSEDHLDRHPSLDEYARAKGQAFVNQAADDVAVIPAGNPVCAAQALRGAGQIVTFGMSGDYRVEGRDLVESATGTRFSLDAVQLHGWHNLLNAAAALAAVRAFGVSASAVEAGLRSFRGLPHRMEFSGEIGGVRFYDDSKGTNVAAAVTALLGLGEERGVLIAGGRDKRGSYAALVEALQRKGRAVVVIGEAAVRIAEAVGTRLRVEHAASMPEAVRRAHRLARPGDAVLLSPACASLDMFEDYADRGRHFVTAVNQLRAEQPAEVEG